MLFVEQSNVGALKLYESLASSRTRRPAVALSPQLVVADESADAERDGRG